MVCEAFSCTPTEALAQPLPLVLEVLEARAFRTAYREVEEAGKYPGLPAPSGPMVEAVMECQHEALEQVKEKRGL